MMMINNKFAEDFPNGIETWEQYSQATLRTMAPRFDPDLKRINMEQHIAHCAMGMTSELDEYYQVITDEENGNYLSAKMELGDACWYAGALWAIMEFDDEIPLHKAGDNPPINDLLGSVTYTILEIAKKNLAYPNYQLDREKLKELLKLYIDVVQVYAVHQLNTDFAAVLTTNIEKLYIRYPEKFSGNLAINKNEADEYERLA